VRLLLQGDSRPGPPALRWVAVGSLRSGCIQVAKETALIQSSQTSCIGVACLCMLESYNHRIIECFGLEGTFKGHLVQHSRNEQGHLQLDQVAQSSVQPDLECFRGWGLHYLSGQYVPVSHHSKPLSCVT